LAEVVSGDRLQQAIVHAAKNWTKTKLP